MNRNGLELLKQVQGCPPGLSSLLKNKLPPVFSFFLRNYQVGPGSIMYEKVVLDDEKMDEYLLSKITMYDGVVVNGEPYSGSLDCIFSHDRLEEELNKYARKCENWHHKGFMQIGLMYYGDVLLVGMEDGNLDQLWRWGQGLLKTPFSKLENDIFDFMRQLKENVSSEDIESWGVSSSDIYKNLEEDFWRIL